MLECLGNVGDPRDPVKVEHRLVDVLAIAVCAVLAHAESFEDIALYGRSKRNAPARAAVRLLSVGLRLGPSSTAGAR